MFIVTQVRPKALNGFLVWMLVVTLLAGADLFATPASALPCNAPTGSGDWTVSDDRLCENIIIVMDGNLSITGTGTLTIRNGGLKFVEDTTHIYSVSVSGDLILENSRVWTETNEINPHLKLSVSVSGATGSLTLTDSRFEFPGTVSASANAQVTLTRSVNSRTSANLATIFTSGSAIDDNDDAAGLTFTDSTVSLFASRVENLYENSTAGFGGDARQSIRLQGSTRLTAVDTFLAIDFKSGVATHNTLALTGTAQAYLYGVTVDTSETAGVPQDQWVIAVTTASGTFAYLYRFADVRVVDANGVPVPGADINADFAGAQSGPAVFPDNGNATNPPTDVMNYLGKTAATWDDTASDGTARMPLMSDRIDASTQPNSRFYGTFTLLATATGGETGSTSLTFDAYPDMDAGSASAPASITIGTLVQPLPDVTPLPPTFSPTTPKEGQTVGITSPIANTGAGGATNVLVRVFDGSTLLLETTIPFIAPGGQESVATSLVNPTGGQHVIRVHVDPDDTVFEGPSGSSAEANNLKGFQLSVTPLGPDLAVDVSFNPDPGFLNNPVQLIAGVTNVGDANATNIFVRFYQQETTPDATSTPIGSATVPFVSFGGSGTASVSWTPTSLGSFTFWAWADPLNAIPEPAPYSETNNLGSNTLTVGPAPDLVTLAQDLTMIDPFPRVGVSGTIEAVVRNQGQADAGAFRVDFFVDGSLVGSQTVAGGLTVGSRTIVTFSPVTFSSCGSHSIEVLVDAGAQVLEGQLYEQNNRVAQSISAFHPTQVLTWASGTIAADQSFASSIEIAGAVTINGASVTIVQDQDPCGRYYVKVLSGGSLTLAGGALTSNWPLVVSVNGGGSLTADDSTFTLDVQGRGILHSRGTLTVRDSAIVGDVVARGASADLRGDTLSGSLLYINTAAVSRIWDSSFPGVASIQLVSDAPGGGAVDFDLRNLTFNAQLTSQLVFSGDQWVHLTSVDLTKSGDWWAGMLTQSAHVTRYWWLNVEAVDGTGTLIADPSTNVTLYRFNPTTLAWDLAPTCTPSDCYLTTSAAWPAFIPTGRLIYRAAAEERFGSAPPVIRATYQASGGAFIEGQARSPDSDVSGLADADTTITLVFSELTPDLSVLAVAFNGENGAAIDSQPLNRELTIIATIQNAGEIITRNVIVYFYATDVDTNRDGFMDQAHAFYVGAGQFIGQSGPRDVPALSTLTFTRTWTPTGTSETTRTVSVVVDPSPANPQGGGAIAELSETNNILTRTITTFAWPDLHFAADPVLTVTPTAPIVNNVVSLQLEVRNEGTNAATDAVFGVFTTANVSLGPTVTASIPRGSTTTVTVTWTPSAAGLQTIRVRVTAAGAIQPSPNFRNYDFDLSDNFADKGLDIRSQPELSISQRGPAPSPFRGIPFDLNLTVNNSGQTLAEDIVVGVVDSTAPTILLGARYGLDVLPGPMDVTVRVRGIDVLGDHTLFAIVDYNSTVTETNEANNQVSIPITVVAPTGSVRLQFPTTGQSFQPGVTISVLGRVTQADGTPIGGVSVTASLLDGAGVTVPGTDRSAVSAANDGSFIIPIDVPAGLSDGTYRLRVDALDASIVDAEIQVVVATTVAWWQGSFLGLPVWIWLLIIIGAAAAIGGGTAYVKFVGLGKLVECGECGAFIPEDSTKCPKCGVEFEQDMAKCSNCQAWIPVDVKQCPECGVEFATGEVEMADYEAQMRRQYEDVKRRFRDEANRQLGRTLSEREFEDWWRTQPTFVTFEDWLREEEEMRRMGSKPCPVCNTLNSVTATVCHKCGTLLKEAPPPRGGGAAPPPIRRAVTPAEGPGEGPEGAEAGMAPPPEAIPRKVVKKPITGAPVVQKKVIRRPLGEEPKEGEEGGEGEQDNP